MNIAPLVSDIIINNKKDKAMLVAFDGVDTSGKTTLADLVNKELLQRKLSPIRVSIDKFHNPREKRIERGPLSPEGYYYDSFNYDKIMENIIYPVKERHNSIIRGVYDYRSEKCIDKDEISINSNSIILFDGVFMNRDELYGKWDYSIFLDVSFETVIKRALERDVSLFGSKEEVLKRYNDRYIPGEIIYLERCNPKFRADLVIDNNDYLNPKVLKNSCT